MAIYSTNVDTNKIMNIDDYPIYTPVLFMVFNRISEAEETFFAIRRAKPLKLYLSVNAPRDYIEGEKEKVNDVINIVLNNVDWDCEVKTLIREEHLDIKNSLSSAIDWVFENEDTAIILEDDCVPASSFFIFCQELLEKYNDNESIMHIGGSNFQDGIIRGHASYYFTAITGIWGWATWKRSWAQYNPNADGAKDFIDSRRINKLLTARKTRKFWSRRFLAIESGNNKSGWDIPWAYSVIECAGLCITPNKNLISNVGFSASATHAFDENSFFSRVPTEELENIVHPDYIAIDHEADNYVTMKAYRETDSTFVVIKSKIKKYFFPFLPLAVKNKLLEINQRFFK